MTGVAACLPGPRPGASPDWSRATALPVPLGVPPDSAAGLAEKVIKEGGMGGGGGAATVYLLLPADCPPSQLSYVAWSTPSAQRMPLSFFLCLLSLRWGQGPSATATYCIPRGGDRAGPNNTAGWLVPSATHH